MTKPVLSIQNLSVDYVTDDGPVRAIDNVSLDVMPGEILGVAGESGSGKTTLAKAIMRILQPPAVISGGRVLFEDKDLLQLDEEGLRRLRWTRMSMVFQSAMDALNPVISIGEQIVDTMKVHTDFNSSQARDRAVHLLEMVGIPGDRIDSHAHQLSGGMRQRVGIALALCLEPSLVILDEPTTALDVVVEKEILGEIKELQNKLGFSVMFITHDLERMLQVSDRVAVFYAARLAEIGPAKGLRDNPQHPYTQGLLKAFPSIAPGARTPESIPGSPPSLLSPPSGCRFHPRCSQVVDACSQTRPIRTDLGPGHAAECHLLSQETGAAT
ncbi:MAG: ABC transporter ATP-binding protein [Candidatus Eisenbacteria bacterium]|uniref:ABC transporter ATP-binding protein n=1 Tax=Eiseniibacteriota bacterium TaxID=2212470 RepID=A0A7Y2H1C1_UNCEI|nr:ABC transporter ATP-binding protein [Candidatus Eisenbacteria bacterium]